MNEDPHRFQRTPSGASLSRCALLRAHQFILRVHAAADAEALRRVIPLAAETLVSSDRANFNEFDISGRRQYVIPAPVPAYWSRLSPILFEHMHEHALGNLTAGPPFHRALTFSDRRHDPEWSKSALFHDYYIPAGARHQLFSHVMQSGSVRFSLAFNRVSRDFAAEDRLVLELVSPHLALAWRNRIELSNVQAAAGRAERRFVVQVERDTARVLRLPEDARSLLEETLAERTRVERPLPDSLRRWFRAQEARMREPDMAWDRPEHWCGSGLCGNVEVRLVEFGADTATLLLVQSPSSQAAPQAPLARLTEREREVLHWVSEGKRNREIGTILNLSSRTVGKHLERVFEKLGVETRSAAARFALQTRL